MNIEELDDLITYSSLYERQCKKLFDSFHSVDVHVKTPSKLAELANITGKRIEREEYAGITFLRVKYRDHVFTCMSGEVL